MTVRAYRCLGIPLLHLPIDLIKQPGCGISFKFLISPKGRICLFLPCGKLHTAVFKETPFAALTLADSHVASAVIIGLIAEHIKKDSVHRILRDHLFQDFQGELLLIGTVHAGRRRVVKQHGIAQGRPAEPFRMRVQKLAVCLTEIKPRDHTDLVFMTPCQKLSKEIIPQIRAGLLALQPCGMKRRDASAAHHTDIGSKFLQIFHIPVNIHTGIDIPQVILYHSISLLCPPAHSSIASRHLILISCHTCRHSNVIVSISPSLLHCTLMSSRTQSTLSTSLCPTLSPKQSP